MTIQTLDWSAPASTGLAVIKATIGRDTWRITPTPGDVVRIGFDGVDADGAIVDCPHDFAYAESVEEAKIAIDVMRAGHDHLPDWKTQLEAAGFVRTYPDAAEDDGLSCIWKDGREDDLFEVTVMSSHIRPGQRAETSVHATYEKDGATSWNNVSRVDGLEERTRVYGDVTIRYGKPASVDVLKTGVAIALAVRAARIARGGAFGEPIGGLPERETKRSARTVQRVR